MGKDHLKRISAPRMWPLLRKANTFITRPKPGRPFALAMPLVQAVKVMGKAQTTKEVRYILFNDEIQINGKRVYDHRAPVGFLDVITFPSIKESYMISLTTQGKLCAVSTETKNAAKHLAKIRGKTRRAGKIQINCYDGSNVTVDKDPYKVGDTVVIENGKIIKHLPLKPGASIILTGGRHLASLGVVKEVEGKTIIFEVGGEVVSTARRYAYVIGEKTPEVTIR